MRGLYSRKMMGEIEKEMKKIREFCRKIFILSPAVTVLIAVPSFLLLVFGFLNPAVPYALQIISYTASAYSLIIVCTCVRRLYRKIKKWLNQLPLWMTIKSNPRYKTILTLIPSLLINAVFVITNMRLGVINHTSWFGFLGLYYLFLAVMKAYLLYRMTGDRRDFPVSEQYAAYRTCGIILLMLNAVLIAESVYIVRKGQSFHYQGNLIFLMAAVIFCNLIMAVVNVIRYKKYHSPVLSAVRFVNLTAAMVSMLALETAMISQFGNGENGRFRLIMTGISAAAVCIIEIGIAVRMIIIGGKFSQTGV